MFFDRLVKNFKKCLTYPSATKDERYKGRGNREKVDQTEEIVRQVNVISNMEEEMDDKEIPVH